MEECFHDAFRELQMREVDIIPLGVDVGEDMSLWGLFRRGSTTEVLYKRL